MKEIGGYIELDKYSLPMYHNGAIALNCGRNCLAYLIETKNIRNILLPCFLCDSVRQVCEKYGVNISYYHLDIDFLPHNIKLKDNEWLYIVNYYGQLSNAVIADMAKLYKKVILDNVQAYFQPPIDGVDTIYTCRKFFGVADGAFLYTDKTLCRSLPIDYSYDRMHFLLGRFEKTASEFYSEYVANNNFFDTEPLKSMSRLTDNLLHAIDYNFVKKRRTENYNYYYDVFKSINKLSLCQPEGAFAYPLYIENGAEIRTTLIKNKIYIPLLWPNVLTDLYCSHNEQDMANNILPLPCDQRYDKNQLEIIVKAINMHIKWR